MSDNTLDPPQRRSDSRVGDASFVMPLGPVTIAITVGSLSLLILHSLLAPQLLPPSIRTVVAPGIPQLESWLLPVVAASLVLSGGYYAVYWYVNRTDSE
jgi:hypothetical protein